MKHSAGSCVRAGIDLGGTGVRIVLLNARQEVASLTVPTASFDKLIQEERLRRLARIIVQMMPADASLLSVGIGASGPVNTNTGVIENSDTLPAFSHFPIVDGLSALLPDIEVRIDNDAVTAAIGEYYLGAGAGCRRMLMVTLGTGIGVSLLIDGKPFRMGDGGHA